MRRWLSDPQDRGAYLLITRSQQLEADAMGYQPQGFLDHLEAALLASDRFTVVYRNEDALIVTLTERTS